MIAKMLRAKVFLLESDFNKVLMALQKKEIFMLDSKYNQNAVKTDYEDDLILRTTKIIDVLEKYRGKKSFFEYNSFNVSEFEKSNEDLINTLIKIENVYSDLNNNIIKNKDNVSLMKKIVPFTDLVIPTSEFDKTAYVDIKIGYVSKLVENFKTIISANEHMEYQILSITPYGQAVALVYEKTYKNEALNILNEYGFKEEELPIDDKLMNDYLNDLEINIEEIAGRILALEAKMNEFCTELPNLRLLGDKLLNQKLQKSINYETTETSIYIEGWIKEKDKTIFEETIKNSTDIYTLELNEPKEDDLVPTVTNNNKIVKNFESITNMYSVPSYNEIDPNPTMAFWYWLIFGIMMGDVGYGLIMLVACGLFLKLKKPRGGTKQLLSIFFYCGIPTIISGMIFGSFFGFSVDFLNFIGNIFGQTWNSFDPVSNPLPLLIFGVGLGAVHMVCGLVIKTFQSIRMKSYLEIIAPISWIFVLCSIPVIVLNMTIGLIFFGIAMFGVMIGSAIIKKGVLGKLSGGFGGLYGITGYLSDLLSYARIAALSLSSAVIGFAMNLLADMVRIDGNWILYIIGLFLGALVFLVGHVFNFVMGMLSAYVHDGRLQYIEFFGKFYEGGGYEFKPLKIEVNYLNNVEFDNL